MAVIGREFPLDPLILGKGSAANISLSAPTSAGTLAAIAANTPFPSAIDLGGISVAAGTGQGVAFKARDASVRFKSSAKVQSGVGIFDSPGDALASLGLDPTDTIDPKIPPAPNSRWALMRWGYEVAGSVAGSHPLGAIGAASFGVDATREAAYAVLHRFDAVTGARDALAATVSSWRLPRHVGIDAGEVNIKPSTWIVAEADGSLALTLAARLGYDVSFTHESATLGLTRDLGATIDANLKATLGVTVSGRYLVVVGREDAHPASRIVRLRLYKQAKQGLGFGLNLNVGVTGMSPLPSNFDGFVEAVFGVHGSQVVKDLRAIEHWTDPSTDLGEAAARLATRTGFDLLQRATGLDLPARFHEARQVVVDALKRWDRLPDRLSALLWEFLSKPADSGETDVFRKLLTSLASLDTEKRREALVAALQAAAVADDAGTRWLQAVASQGLLSLTHDLDRVSDLARETLAILDGRVMREIQRFVTTRLDLSAIRRAVTDDDFNALDEWLVKRLADLLNKSSLQLDDLKQVRQAIFAVDGKVRAIYDQGIKAFSTRYAAEVASTYERSRADTALLDVSFDLGVPAALARFRRVADDGDLDDLLVVPSDGVRFNEGTLSHGIRHRANVEVHLPFVSAETTRVTESLAKLSVEEHAGRVLVYEFDASSKVNTANRARSELSVLGSLRAASGDRGEQVASGTIAYEARQVQREMRPAELEHRTRPFIDAYLAPLFTLGEVSIRAFYADLRATLSAALPGTPNRLGDVAISTELSYPAQVLEGWLLPRDDEAVRRDSFRLSRAVQASLRRLLARTYFEDIDHLQVREPVAALLVWASIPISTSLEAQATPIRFNTDRDVFWDYVTGADRRAVVRDPHTVAALRGRLGEAHARLREAERGDADRFEPADASQFIELAMAPAGDLYLSSLLNAEALMIAGATSALREIARAVKQSRTAPAAAVRALAEFAATLVDTFNGRLQFVYSPDAMRTLGPMMLAECSAAIHPAFQATPPSAALRMYVLKQGHAFTLEQFLKGDLPPADNVAIAETLVRA
jgi:hypothetical protein